MMEENKIESIAVLMTTYNRKEATLNCLSSLYKAYEPYRETFHLSVFLTDDGSADGTVTEVKGKFADEDLTIYEGGGNLYWNGGMLFSWEASIQRGLYDGFLWLNDDVEVLPCLFGELLSADSYCREHYGCSGIYVGSTLSRDRSHQTYGGFNFTNKWTLKDEFVEPNGSFQSCQCAHGNITYISKYVFLQMGMLCNKYIHSGGDHDYTYRAYRKHLPLLVLPSYVGLCDNDHQEDGYAAFMKMNLHDRLAYLKSPLGFNLHNTLLFNRRCFLWRYPLIWLAGYLKAYFPRWYFKQYRRVR